MVERAIGFHGNFWQSNQTSYISVRKTGFADHIYGIYSLTIFMV